jgi:hypothetical protein
MIDKSVGDEDIYALLIVSYMAQCDNNPDMVIDVIKADIKNFEELENYEICARLLKTLQYFE